ncbi:MAG: helix-turn-helix transcriptional regulator [Bacteroidia bacterium]|nr:helix-turn-helix transcriptional regulator [Bacteroidia bacterium]
MDAGDFAKRLSHTIEALRDLRGLKQFDLSDAMGIDQSNYSRAAAGHRPFNTAELQIAADTLKISVLQIIAISYADLLINEELVPLSKLLQQFVSQVEGRPQNEPLTEQEIEYLIKKLRQTNSDFGNKI